MGFGTIRRNKTRNNHSEIEEPDDVFECCHKPDVSVGREYASVSQPTQRDHAEIQECAALSKGNSLIERIANKMVEDLIELRECDSDDQITDDCLWR